MSNVMDVSAAGARVATKSNVGRIENNNLRASYKNMGTARIIWVTAAFLAVRHRVGLLIISNLALLAYISWDKIGYLFF